MIEIRLTGPAQRRSCHSEEIPAIDGAQDESVTESAEIEIIRTISTPHPDLDYYLDDDPVAIASQLKRAEWDGWYIANEDGWQVEIRALYADLIASARLTSEKEDESIVDTLTRWHGSERMADQPVAGALETVESMIDDGYSDWLGEDGHHDPENDEANA